MLARTEHCFPCSHFSLVVVAGLLFTTGCRAMDIRRHGVGAWVLRNPISELRSSTSQSCLAIWRRSWWCGRLAGVEPEGVRAWTNLAVTERNRCVKRRGYRPS
ncbi:hypothetical protein BDW22DRAFT_1033518 [Trametopsis cervina]|nr:hypothetical protein BDW22DRAFT_1033518 [Trametopsis cervina]